MAGFFTGVDKAVEMAVPIAMEKWKMDQSTARFNEQMAMKRQEIAAGAASAKSELDWDQIKSMTGLLESADEAGQAKLIAGINAKAAPYTGGMPFLPPDVTYQTPEDILAGKIELKEAGKVPKALKTPSIDKYEEMPLGDGTFQKMEFNPITRKNDIPYGKPYKKKVATEQKPLRITPKVKEDLTLLLDGYEDESTEDRELSQATARAYGYKIVSKTEAKDPNWFMKNFGGGGKVTMETKYVFEPLTKEEADPLGLR